MLPSCIGAKIERTEQLPSNTQGTKEIQCMNFPAIIKKTGHNLIILENQLLLISMNFTPKTSHSCLKKWYTRFSRMFLLGVAGNKMHARHLPPQQKIESWDFNWPSPDKMQSAAQVVNLEICSNAVPILPPLSTSKMPNRTWKPYITSWWLNQPNLNKYAFSQFA